MEKVRPWCGQPSDRGRLKNRNRTRLSVDAAREPESMPQQLAEPPSAPAPAEVGSGEIGSLSSLPAEAPWVLPAAVWTQLVSCREDRWVSSRLQNSSRSINQNQLAPTATVASPVRHYAPPPPRRRAAVGERPTSSAAATADAGKSYYVSKDEES